MRREDQWSVGSLESQGQQARPRTRKAVSASLENLRKKRNRADKAVKARISRIDQLLLEQCTDIVKLTASKDGLNMDTEEVGQPIRRTSRPIRLRHFPHARTKLLASKIYIGLINIDFFHIVMQIFWEISRDTTFTTVNLPIGTVS